MVFCVCILQVWYSLVMMLRKESPWYAPSIFLIPVMSVVCGTTMIQSGYRGVVQFFLEAWKDFTVEIEPGGVHSTCRSGGIEPGFVGTPAKHFKSTFLTSGGALDGKRSTTF